MENLQKMKYRRCKITPTQLQYARDISTVMAFAIGFIIIGSYEYKLVPHINSEGIEDGTSDYIAVAGQSWMNLISILGYC